MAFVTKKGTGFSLSGNDWRPYGGSLYANGGVINQATYQERVNTGVTEGNFTIFRLINYLADDGNLPSTYDDESRWAKVDAALDAARTAGAKVLLDLSDFSKFLSSVEELDFTVAARESYYDDFTDFLLDRVNTVNGLVYKDDDTIAMMSMFGEPNTDTISDEDMVDMFSMTSAMLKSKGCQSLVGAGGVEYYHPLDLIYAVSTLDYVSSHMYDNNIGYNNQWEYNAGLHQQYARQFNKPWILEEFGDKRHRGDSVRGNFMRFMYNLGLKYQCAGFTFWNWSSAITSNGDDFNIYADVKNIPYTFCTVKMFSHILGYSPRIPVAAAEQADYPG